MQHSLLNLLNIVLDLDAAVDHIIHLDVLQSLYQVLDLHAGLSRSLIKCLDACCYVLEPGGVALIRIALAPIEVACESLSDVVDVLVACCLVLIPNLRLLLNKLSNHGFKLAFELGELQDELDQRRLVLCLLDHLAEGTRFAIVMVEQEPSDANI